MSDTNGQPDPDIRTEPLEDTDENTEEEDRPRPDTDPETEEDTASGGPAD